jgi:hypothetical protein
MNKRVVCVWEVADGHVVPPGCPLAFEAIRAGGEGLPGYPPLVRVRVGPRARGSHGVRAGVKDAGKATHRVSARPLHLHPHLV